MTCNLLSYISEDFICFAKWIRVLYRTVGQDPTGPQIAYEVPSHPINSAEVDVLGTEDRF